MSEYLTINTETDIIQAQPRVDPLPLYGENFFMLTQAIPEYEKNLPNHDMNILVRRLKMTMKKFGGIGLSANQCGVFERVFVIGNEDDSFACINPKVVEQSDELVREKEGCLSFPGMYLTIPRPEWIIAEYITETGDIKRVRFEGITARCFMHELDHMNGVRFVDHVGPVSIQMAKKKQQKLVKSIQRKVGKKGSTFF